MITRNSISDSRRIKKVLLSAFLITTSFQVTMAATEKSKDIEELLRSNHYEQVNLKTELDQYIHFLEKVDPSQAIDRGLLIKRVEALGVVDGLLLPTLIEMDFLMSEGDFLHSALLNEAINVFSPQLAQGLRQQFGLNDVEIDFVLFNNGLSHFNFRRSFGDENTNFGRDDYENRGPRMGGTYGPRFGNLIAGDGVTNFGDREFGGQQGPQMGGFLGRNGGSPIFGNPGLRDDVAARTSGGECVAGCGAGMPVGGAIGGALGGVIGGFIGISVGGAGAIPGMMIGAERGGVLGGIVGCAAGCIIGPPDLGGDDGDTGPRTGGDNGGGTAPKTGGDNGGGTAPKTGGDNGGGTAPKTGGDNGGGTAPKTGGDNGGGAAPKTDDDPKPGKKDERAVNSDDDGIFVINDSNPIVDRRLIRRRIINNALSQDAPLINFKDDFSSQINIGN